jgi:hypothetical protein
VDKAPPCPQSHRRTKDKKRTFDVLPKPDKLIRYRQGWRECGGAGCCRKPAHCMVMLRFMAGLARLAMVFTAARRAALRAIARGE